MCLGGVALQHFVAVGETFVERHEHQLGELLALAAAGKVDLHAVKADLGRRVGDAFAETLADAIRKAGDSDL